MSPCVASARAMPRGRNMAAWTCARMRAPAERVLSTRAAANRMAVRDAASCRATGKTRTGARATGAAQTRADAGVLALDAGQVRAREIVEERPARPEHVRRALRGDTRELHARGSPGLLTTGSDRAGNSICCRCTEKHVTSGDVADSRPEPGRCWSRSSASRAASVPGRSRLRVGLARERPGALHACYPCVT